MNRYLQALLEEAYNTALEQQQYMIAVKISELFNESIHYRINEKGAEQSTVLSAELVCK